MSNRSDREKNNKNDNYEICALFVNATEVDKTAQSVFSAEITKLKWCQVAVVISSEKQKKTMAHGSWRNIRYN